MDLPHLEETSTKTNALTHIYKWLDELRLVQVSDSPRNIYKDFTKSGVVYNTIYIYHCKKYYIVSNETRANRKILTTNELQEFILLYAEHAHELYIEKAMKFGELHYDGEAELSMPDAVFKLKPFKNLNTLHCQLPEIDSVIDRVVEHLPHLNMLHLSECPAWTADDEDNALRTRLVNVERLLKLKNLKHLCLEYTGENVQIRFADFCKLIHCVPLEIFEGQCVLICPLETIDDNSKIESLILTQGVQLKELRISTSLDHHKWRKSYSVFFKILENLTTLHLTPIDEVTDLMLATLALFCTNLQSLTMKRTTFKHITTFSLSPKVRKLHLLECHGLNHKNLRHILSDETSIREFISHNTNYSLREKFENVSISPLIEKLDVDLLDLNKFTTLYNQNESLKHVKWHHKANEEKSNRISLVNIACLRTFVNLETLEMDLRSEMTLNVVLQLRHLRMLTTYLISANVWSDICTLLKHPPLQELKINNDDYIPWQQIPNTDFLTEVISLEMDARACQNGLEFLLQLFGTNSKLKLTLSCRHNVSNKFSKKDFLMSLLTSPNLPCELKEIQICGFVMDRSELRRNPDVAMRNLIFLPRSDDMFSVILCRN